MKRLAWIVVCAMLAGCGESGGPAAKRAATPEEALANMRAAVAAGDADAFAACSDAPAEKRPAVRAFGKVAAAARAFRHAFVKAFGPDKPAPTSGPAGLFSLGNLTLADPDTVKIEVKGDVALVRTSGDTGDPPMRLKRIGGGWLIDTAHVLGDADKGLDPEEFARIMEKVADAITAAKDRIGQPGMTPDKLQQELAKEIGKVIFEETMRGSRGGDD